MEDFKAKIYNLLELIKAYKQLGASHGLPTLPTLPGLQNPPKPKINTNFKAPKLPGIGPDSKKDPKKVAQQIKDGSMSTKTQKVMLKFDKNGQWSLS